MSGSQVISANAKCGYVHPMWSFNDLFQYASDSRLRMDRVSQAMPALSLGTVLGDAAGQE